MTQERPRVRSGLEGLIDDLNVDKFLRALAGETFRVASQQGRKGAAQALESSVMLFSRFSAKIGSTLPGELRVTEDTLSQELAEREGITVRAAHALMLRKFVNNRGLLGRIAREVLNTDFQDATEQDLADIRRVLPAGTFKATISRRLRELRRRKR